MSGTATHPRRRRIKTLTPSKSWSDNMTSWFYRFQNPLARLLACLVWAVAGLAQAADEAPDAFIPLRKRPVSAAVPIWIAMCWC